MERKIVSAIMLMLLLIGILTLAFDIQLVEAEPTTWTVDDDGPADFDTIQAAINAANPGDTILVSSGIYYEYVTVNKTLSLIGEERDTTIIDGSGIDESNIGIVRVTANNVVISGFTIQNGFEKQNGGIGVGANFTYVVGNAITNNTYGIFIGGYGNVITGNILTHNWRATAGGGDGSTISNNLVSNNSHGICPYSCWNNTITSNTIVNNELGMDILFWAFGITITNNTIANNGEGICFLFGDASGAIYHNDFINNTAGISETAPAIEVTWDNGYPSGGNYWSDYLGVDLFSGPYQNETGSDGIGDTAYVIDGNNQDNYPLMNPWVAPPPSYTLTIYSSPTGITFTVDNVSRITPWSGDYIAGTSVSLVMPETHDGYVWSHWLEDGDTNRTKTVTMDTNITLTGVFTLLCDLNEDGIVDMRDISIAAKAFGSYPGHPRWNPIADINKDNKVDMRDIATVARNFGKTA